MQRIWVQLCGRIDKVIILFMHKREREGIGFLSTWSKGGLLALLTRFSIEVFNEGGGLLLRFHFYSTNNNQGSKISTMHKHMSWRLKLDVCATDVWVIPIKWSILQRICKFKLHFEFQKGSYALLSLFTKANLVKHENRLHIQNPCIFLIILDILYALFGVKMK